MSDPGTWVLIGLLIVVEWWTVYELMRRERDRGIMTMIERELESAEKPLARDVRIGDVRLDQIEELFAEGMIVQAATYDPDRILKSSAGLASAHFAPAEQILVSTERGAYLFKPSPNVRIIWAAGK